MTAQKKYDWSKAMTLYEKDRTDRQIATIIGCSRDCVATWRHRQGLANRSRKPKPEPSFSVRALKMHGLGFCDPAIAVAVKSTADEIAAWRKSHGLPPNTEQLRNLGELSPLIQRHLAHGLLTDREIAADVNCRSAYVRAVRRRMRLKVVLAESQAKQRKRQEAALETA